LAIAVALLSPDAWAEVDAEEAKRLAGDLVTRGNELFEEKQFAAALASFEEAYRTFPSPKIHYNLARTLAACERPLEAIDHYERFLKEAGLEESDSRYQKAAEEMTKLESAIGKVAFVTDIVGSTLSLDDGAHEPLPESTIRLLPGPHRVVIETPDGRRFVETVEVTAGETIRVHVLFPTVVAPPPKAPLIAEAAPPAADDTSIVERWWFWAAIGAAVIAVGVGVGVGVATSGGTFTPEGELDVSSTSEWERR
jgi:hypothetical protein